MDSPHPLNTGNRVAATTAASPTIRTPDQRVRVFVSSTLDELAAERAAAHEAITQLRLTPVLFEVGARPYPPRKVYQTYLAQSDIFVGLYWQSYGWVAPSMQVSGLEDEYQLSGEKPKLIYVKTPAPAREPGLQALLDRIGADDVASYRKFSTPDELRELLANDLAQMLTDHFTWAPNRPPPLPVLLSIAIGSLINSAPGWFDSLQTYFVGKGEDITFEQAKQQATSFFDKKKHGRHMELALQNAAERGLGKFHTSEERDRYRSVLSILSEPDQHTEELRSEAMHLFY